MNREQAKGSVTVVGTVAALGLFLPGIDKAWQSSPTDHDMIARCRTGECVYLGAAAVLTLLASYGQNSAAPFIVGFGLALLIVGMQEHALRRYSSDARAD